MCLNFLSDKMSLIRYEDLSLDPFTTTDSLLEFLELKPNKLIEQFLESHTKTQRPGNQHFKYNLISYKTIWVIA